MGVNSNTMLDISTQKYLNTALAKHAASSPQKLAPQAKLLNLKLVPALVPKPGANSPTRAQLKGGRTLAVRH